MKIKLNIKEQNDIRNVLGENELVKIIQMNNRLRFKQPAIWITIITILMVLRGSYAYFS